ncbi:cation diffusion facilitator family transporter [Streptomyces sp. Ag109_G2-6]|uniref:cation diffusion facilitator family transporter n=1 Tax=Streptomyces TaxID=1883 RepID=UPI0009A55999|nr:MULTISPECIES: cation diffusion facilitator family transporter [Streptomyces]RPF30027.1 cation diffusion facilitator family transporter [Streptomyces sp. Ag109_G2-6]
MAVRQDSAADTPRPHTGPKGSTDPRAGAPGPVPSAGGRDGETRLTVWVALAANLAICGAKAVGGVVAGSPALLSEAAHSVADSLNEVFLLASVRRSRRPADARHPFGYGKERFFWSLLAAVGIFVTGGCFSVFQGVEAFRSGGGESHEGYVIGLIVLSVALLAEGGSLLRAFLQVRRTARAAGHGTAEEVRQARDPALRTVLAEDATACVGVLLAMAGMALHMATGQVAYEACASVLIGILLVYVAYVLGRGARDHLIGEAADPQLQARVRDMLEAQPEIDSVTALLTMRLGPDAVLLAAGIDLTAGYDSETVEDAMVRVRTELKRCWPELDQVFLDVTDAAAAHRSAAHRPAPRPRRPAPGR